MHRFLALIAGLAFAVGMPPSATAIAQAASEQHVVLAGGCFWGMEGVFEQLKGVSNVVSGYAGGSKPTAHYETVSTGLTGHAESVDITYDPAKISFRQLLDVYFLVAHDPTQLNRQGPDEGSQYRSEIFYTTGAQRAESLAYIAQLTARKAFRNAIVTKIEALQGFYPAEAYHQHFMQHNPDNPYIVYNDKPKVEALHKRFPNLVKVQ